MRRSLPESPRWYETQGDDEAADRAARVIEDRARAELGRELPEPEPAQPTPATGTATLKRDLHPALPAALA